MSNWKDITSGAQRANVTNIAGPSGWTVFMSLLSFARDKDTCHPSYSALSEDSCLSLATVKRVIKRLLDANIITYIPGNARRSNVYTIIRNMKNWILGRSKKSGKRAKQNETKTTAPILKKDVPRPSKEYVNDRLPQNQTQPRIGISHYDSLTRIDTQVFVSMYEKNLVWFLKYLEYRHKEFRESPLPFSAMDKLLKQVSRQNHRLFRFKVELTISNGWKNLAADNYNAVRAHRRKYGL